MNKFANTIYMIVILIGLAAVGIWKLIKKVDWAEVWFWSFGFVADRYWDVYWFVRDLWAADIKAVAA